ncbi:MAG: Propionate catabolism operon transcriptional regulator of GntR family [Olavius algarvensis Gamma 3 endosymbiont]|nr:MAG: Propionate catabolism operon transcriptional regulator of GntR family [Olavius algarvensis Gamma 3 endosymbiont]
MPETVSTLGADDALESTTLASRTFDSIKADIIGGELEQGTKIVESDLALKYGISRGPLREAIHRLEQIKLIVRVPHAGSRVVTLDSKMMQDIYIARESLEGMAARLAARLMPEDEIRALSELLDQHEATIGKTDGKAYFQREGDIDFHYRIAAASRNQWILEHLNGELYQLIRMCRRQSGQFPARAQTALDQHRQIAAAIARRDQELAEILMRRHISGAWEIVKKILEDRHD